MFANRWTGLPSYLHWSINSDEATHNVPKSKAKMFNLEAVTGRTIAYACVQVRDFVAYYPFYFLIQEHQTYIALSTMPKWGNAHDQFRLYTFYDNIVSMFEENADSPWVKETLSWWSMYVDIFL